MFCELDFYSIFMICRLVRAFGRSFFFFFVNMVNTDNASHSTQATKSNVSLQSLWLCMDTDNHALDTTNINLVLWLLRTTIQPKINYTVTNQTMRGRNVIPIICAVSEPMRPNWIFTFDKTFVDFLWHFFSSASPLLPPAACSAHRVVSCSQFSYYHIPFAREKYSVNLVTTGKLVCRYRRTLSSSVK